MYVQRLETGKYIDTSINTQTSKFWESCLPWQNTTVELVAIVTCNLQVPALVLSPILQVSTDRCLKCSLSRSQLLLFLGRKPWFCKAATNRLQREGTAVKVSDFCRLLHTLLPQPHHLFFSLCPFPPLPAKYKIKSEEWKSCRSVGQASVPQFIPSLGKDVPDVNQ